jgi:hypothetical protein
MNGVPNRLHLGGLQFFVVFAIELRSASVMLDRLGEVTGPPGSGPSAFHQGWGSACVE